MKRAELKSHKRAVQSELKEKACSPSEAARHSALALLARSISFRHERLALRRLQTAIELGARVPPAYWQYCSGVALAGDSENQALYLSAARAARMNLDRTVPIIAVTSDPHSQEACNPRLAAVTARGRY